MIVIRRKEPDAQHVELGKCEVGDVIVGAYDRTYLEVTAVQHDYDDIFSYTCKYVDGPFKGETIIVKSYYNYRRI